MSTSLPPAFEPRSREDRTSRVKYTLLVVMISVVVTFLICVVGAVVFYFVAPFAYSPPEDVEIAYEYPARVRPGELFDVEIRITNLADDARVLDSIDVNDGFLAGVLLQRSSPPWQSSSHLYGEFVTYGFLTDIPPRAEAVVTFHAQALREGDFMDTWAVCIDAASACSDEVLRMIVSEPDEE